jgi:hypothetical protein
LPAIPCDERKLCVDVYVFPVPQLIKEHDSFALESDTCAKNKLFFPIAIRMDELKLLHSLNILSYIKFYT